MPEDAGGTGFAKGWFDVFPDPLGWALAVAGPPSVGGGPAELVRLAHLDSRAQALARRLRDHPGAVHAPDEPPLPALRRQLGEYFAGRRRTFDLPLGPRGTAFQQEVWTALREIPFGETRSYGEIAAALGRPGAARAVGQANGRNPLGVIVPCHRVVAAGGRLGGYTGGLHRKRRLLAMEGGATAGSGGGGGPGETGGSGGSRRPPGWDERVYSPDDPTSTKDPS